MAIKNDYQAGTVSIANGSTALTGAGGAMWVAADIQPGDTLKVQNLDAIVASVNSNTSITLKEPWTGDTLSASPYAIRYQPDGSRFTAALRDLVTAIGGGSLAALQAVTGAANKLPYFNSASTMVTTDLTAEARTILASTTPLATLGGQPVGYVAGAILSVVSGTPVPSNDVVGATTVYVMPSPSNMIEVWDGTRWQARAFSQVAIPLATFYAADSNFDVFGFDNDGTVQFGTKIWASQLAGSSSRGSGAGTAEIELFQGRLVNKFSIVLRNGSVETTVPARQATLIGGFRTTALGTTEDSRAKRLVSNLINIAERDLLFQWPDASWAGSGAQWVPAKAGNGNSRVDVFHCVDGRRIELDLVITSANAVAGVEVAHVGIGVNVNNAAGSQIARPAVMIGGNATSAEAKYNGSPGLGYNRLFWLEFGIAGTMTWYGTSGNIKSGLMGRTFN